MTGRNPEDALNYNRAEHVAHDRRYERAEEFVDVCFGLWDSYDADAFLVDTASGRYLHPDRYRLLHHEGANFTVKGPLNVPRPVQGRPVIVQAGASEAGRPIAAETAEVIFGASDTLAGARDFYADVKNTVYAPEGWTRG